MSEKKSFPANSSKNEFFLRIKFYLDFAHKFLTVKRKFIPHSFTAEIKILVLSPISGLDLFIFLKITEAINFGEQ